MIDPDRLKRLHVHNVRVKIKNKGKGLEEVVATIDLADETGYVIDQMDWSIWCKGGCKAVREGKW
jgi:6-pyruvoyl-tetrahydropterin synthase